MKFVGPTIIYSFLQAIGVIYSHEDECFLYKNSWKEFFYSDFVGITTIGTVEHLIILSVTLPIRNLSTKFFHYLLLQQHQYLSFL